MSTLYQEIIAQDLVREERLLRAEERALNKEKNKEVLLMFRFGYDFYNNDKQKVLLPNGVLNQENADGRVFKLYLPPWWGHLLRRINLDFEVRSVEDLSGKELTTKWIYLLEPFGDPYGWLGYEQEWLYQQNSEMVCRLRPRNLETFPRSGCICITRHGVGS